jgi:hypothetical protein
MLSANLQNYGKRLVKCFLILKMAEEKKYLIKRRSPERQATNNQRSRSGMELTTTQNTRTDMITADFPLQLANMDLKNLEDLQILQRGFLEDIQYPQTNSEDVQNLIRRMKKTDAETKEMIHLVELVFVITLAVGIITLVRR